MRSPFSGRRWLSVLFMLSMLATQGWSQEWLSDNSYRHPAPPVISEHGLSEPPPPLTELPASVFDSSSFGHPSGPIWYQPWTWIPLDGWENSAELGINGATGNTESLTLQSGARFKRKSEWTMFDLRLLQNRTTNSGAISQNNVLLYADLERKLAQSRWNTFVKQGLEYDELRRLICVTSSIAVWAMPGSIGRDCWYRPGLVPERRGTLAARATVGLRKRYSEEPTNTSSIRAANWSPRSTTIPPGRTLPTFEP